MSATVMRARPATRPMLRAGGDDDGGMPEQVVLVERTADARQRMRGRDAEREVDRAQSGGVLRETGRRVADRQGQIGAAFAQRLPGAGHDLDAEAQARAAIHRLEGANVLDQGGRRQQ
jgi:hypothetical protein